jgi:hypothetical protein
MTRISKTSVAFLLSEIVEHIDEIENLSKTLLKLRPNRAELKKSVEVFSDMSKLIKEYLEVIFESIKEDRGVISSVH